MLDSSTHQAITPQMVQRFAATARKRMRIDGGGYRCDDLRAFAQRVEVAKRKVFIKGSKDNRRPASIEVVIAMSPLISIAALRLNSACPEHDLGPAVKHSTVANAICPAIGSQHALGKGNPSCEIFLAEPVDRQAVAGLKPVYTCRFAVLFIFIVTP